MQVSVERTSELKRKVKVQVPEDSIQLECAKRIESLAQKVRLDGFRPGKVPIGIIRKRFGASIRNEVVDELIRSSLADALTDHNLRPAGMPYIENAVNEAGQGLEFEARFEIYPDVEMAACEELEIARPVCEISATDIDQMIEKLRNQNRTWQNVERAADQQDRVTLSFSCTVEGENITDGTTEDFKVEIGSGTMIPGFEANLIGLRAGDEKTFVVDFPENYSREKFAGKAGEFKVVVKTVEQPVLPEIDAEFVKGFGIESGDLEEFRNTLKENMENQKNRAIQQKIKAAAMDAILAANTVTLPDVMVDAEIEQLKKRYSRNSAENPELLDDEQRDQLEAEARRRVKLALLFGELITRNGLKADRDRVSRVIQELAQNSDQPEAVVNWYQSNPEHRNSIERMVLEDQVVELILQRVRIRDEPVEFARLTTLE